MLESALRPMRVGPSFIAFLLAASTSSSARLALADPPPRYGVWDRFTFDWGYEFGWAQLHAFNDVYSLDPATGRQASAIRTLEYGTGWQGLMLQFAYSVRPRIGIGPEVSVHEDFSRAPSDPMLERTGGSFGSRRTLSLGVVIEFRPWQDSYAPRRGWSFPVGVRRLLTDYRVTHGPDLMKPGDGYHDEGVMIWSGVGYRLPVSCGGSFHALVHAGMGTGLALVGIRIGGGFH